MIQFVHPGWLLALLVPLAQAVWSWRQRGQPLVLPFDHGAIPSRAGWRRVVDFLGLAPAGLLAVVIVLLARPQRAATPENRRDLTNIQFCLDVSGSMRSPFGDGTRSDHAIRAIQDFTEYRKGDAFGLTIFGSDVLHWVPVTRDLSALRMSAPFLRPERMPPYLGGTQIGKALRSVRAMLVSRPEGDRMVILVSDGESADLYGGQAEEIGQELRRDGIVVFYIHVAEGQPQEETFTVARLTGGEAFAAGDPSALKEVFGRIDRMKPARLKPAAPEWVDDHRWVAGAGLALVALHLVALAGLRYTPW